MKPIDDPLRVVLDALRDQAIPAHPEKAMQDGLQVILQSAGVECHREVRLSHADRIDFLAGPIGIECKVAGSYSSVASQLLRYMESDQIKAIVLVTNKASHRCLEGMPNERGIPVHVIFAGWYGF